MTHPTLTTEAAQREYRSATFGYGETLVDLRSGLVALRTQDGEIRLLPEQAERLAAQLRLSAKRLRKGGAA